MIQLTAAQAALIKNLLEEILAVNDRANCSDKFFRNHFMAIVKANVSSGTYKTLLDALNAPESDFDGEAAQPSTAKKSAAKATKKPE